MLRIHTADDRVAVPVPAALAALLPVRSGPGQYDLLLVDAAGVAFEGRDEVGGGHGGRPPRRTLVWGRLGARLRVGDTMSVTTAAGSGVVRVVRVRDK